MTLAEFRAEMEQYRKAAERHAISLKESQRVLVYLDDLYRRFDDDERDMANIVLAEWLLSPEEAVRFDAEHVVRHFKITAAAPALKDLCELLEQMKGPGAPHELIKVRKILEEIRA